MRGDQTRREHQDADAKRSAADPEQLIEIALQSVGAIGEISAECFAEFAGRSFLNVAVGKMNDVDMQFATNRLSNLRRQPVTRKPEARLQVFSSCESEPCSGYGFFDRMRYRVFLGVLVFRSPDVLFDEHRAMLLP